jgi:TolB-like protein
MSRLPTLLGLTLFVSSLALAAETPKKLKVAIVPLKALGGVKQDVANVVTEQLAGAIQQKGYAVMSPDDLQARLGFERQKQLLGCTDASCLVEIGAALGVERLVSGTVAIIGQSVVINLALINNETGVVDYRYSERVKQATDEAFLDLVPKAVAALFPSAPAGKSEVVKQPEEQPAPASATRTLAWVAGAVAVVGLGVGGFGVWKISDDASRIHITPTPPNASELQADGKLWTSISIAGFAVGGALAVTSLILFVISGRSGVAVSFAPTANGGVFAFGGVF